MKNFSKSIPERNLWTFNWQRNYLAPLLKNPNNWNKIKEYWIKFRYLNEILNILIIKNNTKLLDVGCGLTSVLGFLKGKCLCLDPLIHYYTHLNNYPKSFYLIESYGEFIPINNNSIDIVFCSNTIDHVIIPENVIQEISRVLRNSGYLVLTCEIFKQDLGQRNPGHPHTFTAKKLKLLIDNWKIIRFWKSPWIGIYNFLNQKYESITEEYIYLCQK